MNFDFPVDGQPAFEQASNPVPRKAPRQAIRRALDPEAIGDDDQNRPAKKMPFRKNMDEPRLFLSDQP